MSKLPLFCITLLLLTVSSALTQDVRYNFDDTVDFSKFKTYGSLGALMILLACLYVTSLAYVIGTQIDAEIARARKQNSESTPQ
jgi:hypothetical protein